MTDSPLTAFRQMISSLKEAEAAKDRPKDITLASIPRQLALRIVGDYAADTKRVIPPGLMSALHDKVNKKEILIVIDGIPTLAMYGDVPLFAAWTWPGQPVGQALREVEEHPEMPGLAHFPGLVGQSETAMMWWINEASKQARALTFARPSDGCFPALPFMPEGWQDNNKSDADDDGLIREPLSDDAAIAFEQFKDSLKDQVHIIEAEMMTDNGFAFGLKNPEPELLAQIKEHMADRFNAHIETRSGDYGLTVIHLSKKRILS